MAQGSPGLSEVLGCLKRLDGKTRLIVNRSGTVVDSAANEPLLDVDGDGFGRTTTEQQVLVNMLRIADPDNVRQKGFSLLDMKTYAQSVGYKAEGYRVDYATLRKLEVPSIALLDISGYKHFVVIRRAWDDRVAIGDPAIGNMTMTRPRFEEAWNGILFVVSGDDYVADNILLNPPEPLSAKRLLELTATMPSAEITEFGFGPRISF